MKTIDDFKVIDGVAVLEGVMLASEASIVKDFLINHKEIKYASVYTNDKRYFKLENDRLISSHERTFENPYYIEPIVVEEKEPQSIDKLKELEERISILESKLL